MYDYISMSMHLFMAPVVGLSHRISGLTMSATCRERVRIIAKVYRIVIVCRSAAFRTIDHVEICPEDSSE